MQRLVPTRDPYPGLGDLAFWDREKPRKDFATHMHHDLYDRADFLGAPFREKDS